MWQKYSLDSPGLLPNPDYIEEFKKITKKALILWIRLSLLKG